MAAIKAKYTSKSGEFLLGIPARDLDEDEYAALDVDQKRAVRSSAIYDVKSDADAAPRSGPAAADARKGDN